MHCHLTLLPFLSVLLYTGMINYRDLVLEETPFSES